MLGLVAYVVCSIGCAMAPNLRTFVALRLLEGSGRLCRAGGGDCDGAGFLSGQGGRKDFFAAVPDDRSFTAAGADDWEFYCSGGGMALDLCVAGVDRVRDPAADDLCAAGRTRAGPFNLAASGSDCGGLLEDPARSPISDLLGGGIVFVRGIVCVCRGVADYLYGRFPPGGRERLGSCSRCWWVGLSAGTR